MAASNVGFQEVVEWASHLSREERLRLVACIGAGLSVAPAEAAQTEAPAGSAMAVLQAIREPPHLSAEDVETLEQAIAAGKQTVRQEGIFDRGGAK